MVGVCCGAALDSPSHGCVLSSLLAIEDLGNENFGDVNDGKICTLFIRTTISGGIVSMSQMSRNLSPPRAEPVKRGLPTFSSLLFTVICVKTVVQKRHLTVPRRSEIQSEYKEKQEKAKGKLQSDIQCTFY